MKNICANCVHFQFPYDLNPQCEILPDKKIFRHTQICEKFSEITNAQTTHKCGDCQCFVKANAADPWYQKPWCTKYSHRKLVEETPACKAFTYSKRNLLSFLEVCAACSEKTALEYRPKDSDLDWKPFKSECINCDRMEYRYADKKTKWVPWTQETAPKCGEVLIGKDKAELLITGKFSHGLGINGIYVAYTSLLQEDLKYNNDKCGVLQ